MKKTEKQHSATTAKNQEAQMSNITAVYKAGKLKVAGSFGDDGDWRGIFIFDCETKDDVKKLLQADAAISLSRLKKLIILSARDLKKYLNWVIDTKFRFVIKFSDRI